MESFSAFLAICAGNSPVAGKFPAQRPVTLGFDAFFDLRLNKRLSKQSWDWWFETLSRQLWRHSNAMLSSDVIQIKITIYYMPHIIYTFYYCIVKATYTIAGGSMLLYWYRAIA